MDEERLSCAIYVDYEDLLAGLSHLRHPAISDEAILEDILTKARQRFDVQQTIVLGTWSSRNRRRVERLGAICRTVNGGEEEFNKVLRNHSTKSSLPVSIYLLVGNRSRYASFLEWLTQTERRAILWTLVPPTLPEQILCASWEIIAPLTPVSHDIRPRQVLLCALILVADHLQRELMSPFSFKQLLTRLRLREPFSTGAEKWLAQAQKEHLLLLSRTGDPLTTTGSVNKRHPLVQRTQIMRERILSTLSILQSERGWTAFNTLEGALRTTRPLAGSQRLRHAWLNLLVAERVLLVRSLPQPDGPFLTTAISLNSEHPASAIVRQQQQYNLIRLIVVSQNYLQRKRYNWIAASHVLKLLSGPITHVEARAALSQASEQSIVHTGTIPGKHDQERSITTIRLQPEHDLVQEGLLKRDRLIVLTEELLGQRPHGVSETVLMEEFCSAYHVQENEAWFWIRLLEEEHILSVMPMHLGQESSENIVDLRLDDPVVYQALEQAMQHTRERK